MVNENAEKDRDTGPENIRHNFRLGDITWVKYSGSSWWPAQVIDESCVGSKPKKKDKYDSLVRLYGTCQYLYVDPWKSKSEFEMMLKQENKSAMEAFREVLEKELSGISLCRDGYEEEAVNSKGGDTKGTSKKNSSRKARKQEGLKQQYNEQEDQNVGINATIGNSRKRKGGRARQSSSTNDVIDKDHSDSSAEGLRNKRQHETPADHTEIKAMVRDILFKDIIDKEHDAEMAYVDEVINGICNTTDSVIGGGGDASTKGGLGFKQSGIGVEGESSNVTQKRKDEATEDAFQVMSPKTMKGHTPSRRTKAMTPEQLRARHNRQNRIMQTLALIPPSGSPFGRNEEVAASRQKF